VNSIVGGQNTWFHLSVTGKIGNIARCDIAKLSWRELHNCWTWFEKRAKLVCDEGHTMVRENRASYAWLRHEVARPQRGEWKVAWWYACSKDPN